MKTDVAVIGAGVVGCAIARELSRWNVSNAAIPDKLREGSQFFRDFWYTVRTRQKNGTGKIR